MSPKRWALSLFFVWHVIAMGLGSIATTSPIAPIGAPRHPTSDAIAATLTPVLDRTAAIVGPLTDTASRAGGPVRRLADRYLEITGIPENWKMFSGSLKIDQYLRVRYYIGRVGQGGPKELQPTWTATELVLPAHREDQVRLFQAYRDSARDKAMTIALQRFHQQRENRLIKPDTQSDELPDQLAPIGRYFARRFARANLRADERILRTEVWYGMAPALFRVEGSVRTENSARLTVLRGYYDGPVQEHPGRVVYPPYYAQELETDIRWVLEYFEP